MNLGRITVTADKYKTQLVFPLKYKNNEVDVKIYHYTALKMKKKFNAKMFHLKI